MTTAAFLTFGVISLCYTWKWLCIGFMSALIVKYLLKYFYDTWLKCTTGQDDLSRIRMITLAFLLLELSPFVFFLKLISCPLCHSNTFLNNLMIFGWNVEQDETVCRVQEWSLCLSYLWRYLPLLYLTMIMHWFPVSSVNWVPFRFFMILGRNEEQD